MYQVSSALQDELFAEIERTHQETGKEVLEFDDLLGMKFLTACMLGEIAILFPSLSYT